MAQATAPDSSSSSSSSRLEDEKEARVRATEVEMRAQALSRQVRCLDCANQSIEESQADIAVLMRKLIRDELKKGRSDKEVLQKLKEDYGDSVLYTPPFDAQTALLWMLPGVILGGAAALTLRRPSQAASFERAVTKVLDRYPELTPAERVALKALLRPKAL